MRDRTTLTRWAFWLAYATIGWNAIEAVIAVSAGLVAGSIALIGFGFDSTIEVFSAIVVIWRLRGAADEREERALKLIAVSFFVLAAYVTVQSVYDLATAARPGTSTVGIVLTALSLVVMPALAWGKRRVGRAMGSAVVLADSVETLLCTYLSAIVLAGLALNAWLGWWWADPVAALGVAWLAFREGREAWEGDEHGAELAHEDDATRPDVTR